MKMISQHPGRFANLRYIADITRWADGYAVFNRGNFWTNVTLFTSMYTSWAWIR